MPLFIEVPAPNRKVSGHSYVFRGINIASFYQF